MTLPPYMRELIDARAEIERLQNQRSSCCQEDGDSCGPFNDQQIEIERLRAAGEFFIWVMDQKLFMPDLMLEAAEKMRRALANDNAKSAGYDVTECPP